MLADLVLSRSATDRYAEMRKDPERVHQALNHPDTRFLCVHNSQAPMVGSGLRFFELGEIPEDSATYFLGYEGTTAYFGFSVDADFVSGHEPDSWVNLRATGISRTRVARAVEVKLFKVRPGGRDDARWTILFISLEPTQP